MTILLCILVVYLIGIPISAFIMGKWFYGHFESYHSLVWPLILLLVIAAWMYDKA